MFPITNWECKLPITNGIRVLNLSNCTTFTSIIKGFSNRRILSFLSRANKCNMITLCIMATSFDCLFAIPVSSIFVICRSKIRKGFFSYPSNQGISQLTRPCSAIRAKGSTTFPVYKRVRITPATIVRINNCPLESSTLCTFIRLYRFHFP